MATKREKAEFVHSIEQLKQTITRAVTNAVDNFETDTGLTPSSIVVELHEVSTHGDAIKRHAIGRVRVGFEF